MRKILFLAAMPFMLAGMPAKAQVTGEFGIVEHACVLPIATFVFQNCGFSGGANIAADLTGGNEWIGPLDSGGFYTSIAAAPGFVLSTQTGVDADGTALNTFMVYEGSSAGDGKVAPSVTSNISVDTGTNMVSGSFTIGAGARAASGGGTLAGSAGTVESWTSIVHVLTAKTADSVIGGNAFGGSDYILGSIGFPSLDTLCTANNCYGNVETAATSGAPANTSPWAVATGGTGPQSSVFGTTGVDIVSYTNAFPVGAPANVGTKTTATMNDFDCVDNGIEPREAGDPVTTDTGCMVSSIAWGSEIADPIDGLARNNASFDNVIMKVSTDSGDNVVAVEAYYLLEYSIIAAGANSNVGGIFVAIVPVPAAVWLFGSALGLLGWIRRRVAV